MHYIRWRKRTPYYIPVERRDVSRPKKRWMLECINWANSYDRSQNGSKGLASDRRFLEVNKINKNTKSQILMLEAVENCVIHHFISEWWFISLQSINLWVVFARLMPLLFIFGVIINFSNTGTCFVFRKTTETDIRLYVHNTFWHKRRFIYLLIKVKQIITYPTMCALIFFWFA